MLIWGSLFFFFVTEGHALEKTYLTRTKKKEEKEKGRGRELKWWL